MGKDLLATAAWAPPRGKKDLNYTVAAAAVAAANKWTGEGRFHFDTRNRKIPLSPFSFFPGQRKIIIARRRREGPRTMAHSLPAARNIYEGSKIRDILL